LAAAISSGASVLAPGTSGTSGRSTGSREAPARAASPLTMVPSGRTVRVRTRRLTRPSSLTSAAARAAMSVGSLWSRETSCSSAGAVSVVLNTTEAVLGVEGVAGGGTSRTGVASALEQRRLAAGRARGAEDGIKPDAGGDEEGDGDGRAGEGAQHGGAEAAAAHGCRLVILLGLGQGFLVRIGPADIGAAGGGRGDDGVLGRGDAGLLARGLHGSGRADQIGGVGGSGALGAGRGGRRRRHRDGLGRGDNRLRRGGDVRRSGALGRIAFEAHAHGVADEGFDVGDGIGLGGPGGGRGDDGCRIADRRLRRGARRRAWQAAAR
jgi:hypothetical protein